MSIDYRDALRSISNEKNIPFDELLILLEGALASLYKRTVASDSGDEPLQIRTEVGENDVRLFCMKKVVKYADNPKSQILLSDALKLNPNAKIGDAMEVEVTPANFGNTAVRTAMQVLSQRIKQYEEERAKKQYSSQIGQIINAHISRREGRCLFVTPDGYAPGEEPIEAILPPGEQVESEHLQIGDMVKVYVVELRMKKNGRTHELIVSRSHPTLLRRLFANECEEIASGIVQIVSLAREPGVRSKIAVKSSNPNIDPIGACVGIKGSRMYAINRELRGEKVDVVLYSDNPEEYIKQAVSPAHVKSVSVDETEKIATVVVPAKELSLAIGKNGINAKLAARMTGWKIDIKGK